MNIHGSFKYKSAIILTRERVKEIEKTLLKDFNDLNCYVITYSKDTVRFDTIDELLDYDNFGEWKIKSLHIDGTKPGGQKIEIYFRAEMGLLVSFSSTIEISYTVSDLKEIVALKEQALLIFKKCKAPYNLISKFALYSVICIISIVSAIFTLSLPDVQIATLAFNVKSIVVMMLTGIIAGFLIIKFPTGWGKLFPPIVYYWGEEIGVSDRRNQLRTNIFWGVFVALIIGVITTYITNGK